MQIIEKYLKASCKCINIHTHTGDLKNNEIKNNTKGITLIALVITIIVLLILAGIAISMLTGDNGLLQKTTEAKYKTENASVIEQIKLAVMGAMGTDGKIDYNKLKEELKNKEIDVVDNGTGYVITKGNIMQVINKSGETVKVEETTNSSQNGSIALSDKTETLKGLKIYGNSIQDGTPTEEEPVEIKSVGNLVTNTEDSNYGKYEVDVIVRRKNLFKYVAPEVVNGRIIETLENGAILKGNEPATDADLTAYSRGWFRPGCYSSFGNGTIKLGYNETVTVSADITFIEKYNDTSTQTIGLYIYAREVNSGYVSLIYGLKNARLNKTYRISQTFTNTKVSWSAYHFYPIITLNSNKVKIENIQIEEGSTATSFEKYVEPVTTKIYLSEPLRKIGDYADYIDFKNKKIIRRVEVIDNTGKLPLEQSLRGLATPTEESINLPTIQVKAGVSIIDVETEITPSNIEASYYINE